MRHPIFPVFLLLVAADVRAQQDDPKFIALT